MLKISQILAIMFNSLVFKKVGFDLDLLGDKGIRFCNCCVAIISRP
ncbi:hypothetical protein FLJC2902T_11430 [Flavobacterium limnosediminis JC2902]|uniref:Uncharacterized protein n=1 Tax=Flavobacterium limnosediminis JC2902 TaxID=1341181 RepID=V6SRM0_9FLAO|nr:hypothetical protein FLJC2902T_11430 [Flavobacterium limnosediminis JC2902]